jgi:hypothetical protein
MRMGGGRKWLRIVSNGRGEGGFGIIGVTPSASAAYIRVDLQIPKSLTFYKTIDMSKAHAPD